MAARSKQKEAVNNSPLVMNSEKRKYATTSRSSRSKTGRDFLWEKKQLSCPTFKKKKLPPAAFHTACRRRGEEGEEEDVGEEGRGVGGEEEEEEETSSRPSRLFFLFCSWKISQDRR